MRVRAAHAPTIADSARSPGGRADPGLVQISQWQPDDEPGDSSGIWIYGGIARKP